MPGRRRFKRLLTDPGLEYEIYLARKLHMTLGEMRARMSSSEFALQRAYDQRRAQRMQLEEQKAKARAGRRRR